MSSWFSMDTLKGLTDTVTDLTGQITEAIPVDKKMLEKLTLTTPELSATWNKIDEEERRKDRVRNSLAGMLPWETKDSERDILVEECKEAILKLSNDMDTFFGPFEMPPLAVKQAKKATKTDDDEDEEDESKAASSERKPSKQSLDNLAKLEPLPTHLAEFDLDAHVGLIKRLLQEDSRLVEIQGRISGGGVREKTFWRNYFFHCAFTRYTAGLSIDEIWSEEEASTHTLGNEQTTEGEHEEETIHFESVGEVEAGQTAATDTAVVVPQAGEDLPAKESSKPASTSLDFHLDSADDVDFVDPELDELEAEIARELEN